MVKYTIFLAFLFIQIIGYAQAPQRPKLVVGIVVDQMRWDYLSIGLFSDLRPHIKLQVSYLNYNFAEGAEHGTYPTVLFLG